MDPTEGPTAADLLAELPEREIADLILSLWRGAAFTPYRSANRG